MARKTTAAPITPETRELVYSLIQATSEPVTSAQIAKSLVAPHKLSEAKVIPILDDLVASSRLQAFPPKTAKGKPRYWDRGVEQLGQHLIVEVLTRKGAQSKADLRKAARQLSDAQFESAFQRLIDSRGLYEHPPLPKKKSVLFGSQPPSPEPYLKEVSVQLGGIIGRLVAAGVAQAELRRALFGLVEGTGVPLGANVGSAARLPAETTVDLVALMRRIEPAADSGALVAARELRRAADLEKPQFDRAVLDLARQGCLMLHRHDFAGGLSPAERDELVSDGAGTYYVGMALRRDAAG